MPITITPEPGNPVQIGWGVSLHLTSDFVGPLETGTTMTLATSNDSEFTRFGPFTFREVFVPEVHLALGVVPELDGGGPVTFALGEPAQVRAQLLSPTSVILDEGFVTLPWQTGSSDGFSWQAYATKGSKGQGLTDEQSLQLSETHAATFPDQLLDTLTLNALTTGPTGDPVAADIVSWAFGVLVRIATVPAELEPNTPDGNYWVPSLAVVRLFRGSDLWLRVPVHTSSKIIPFANENLVVALAATMRALWTIGLSVQVTFREGVTGEVFLMRFP